MKGVMESTRAQIRASLTPDQQKVFDTLAVHARRGPAEPATPPAPTPPPTT
jgi:hypothetical protein